MNEYGRKVNAVQWHPGDENEDVFDYAFQIYSDKTAKAVEFTRMWPQPIKDGDWIVTYSDGTKELWDDESFRKEFVIVEGKNDKLGYTTNHEEGNREHTL